MSMPHSLSNLGSGMRRCCPGQPQAHCHSRRWLTLFRTCRNAGGCRQHSRV